MNNYWIPGGGFDEFETEKYKKRTQSDTSKSKYKTKHKHNYTKECLVVWNKVYYHARYCAECGKIKNISNDTIKLDDGRYKMLTNEEMLKKYKGLDIKEVDSLLIKYIPIEEEKK